MEPHQDGVRDFRNPLKADDGLLQEEDKMQGQQAHVYLVELLKSHWGKKPLFSKNSLEFEI